MPNNNWMTPNYGAYPNYSNTNAMNYPQQVPSQQQSTSSIMTIFVNGEEEVLNYPVAAGLSVILMDFNHNKFYLKSTGVNGVPQPLRVFPFEENVQVPTAPTPVTDNYVTKDEFAELSSKLERLLTELGGVKNE